MLIIILLISILFIVIATSKLKIHPFIVLLIASYGVAITAGMPFTQIAATIAKGFGGILEYIGLVIILGTIIGVILEKSGAAIKMADIVLKLVGEKRPVLAMSIIGYIISIPVFCDSAFVILSSLKKSLIQKTNTSAVAMSIALATGLYATHTLVPPTPGPIAAAGNLGLQDQLGLVIIIGILISTITMFAGYLFAIKIGSRYKSGEDTEAIKLNEKVFKKQYGKLPSGLAALLPIFLPILLIGAGSIANFPGVFVNKAELYSILDFLGKPLNALFIGFLCSLFLLPNLSKETLHDWIGEGIKSAAAIIMITGAGGAFGTILKATHIGDYLGELLSGYNLRIFLPFIIAAALKTAQGSSTVALVTTSALVAPLLTSLGLDSIFGKVLTVMAIGAGAMTVSHANDSYFWVVTQFSKMEVITAYKTQTLATLVQGLVTIVVVFLLNILFI